MTKADLMQYLQAFTDDCSVTVQCEGGPERQIIRLKYVWEKYDDAAHVVIVGEEIER